VRTVSNADCRGFPVRRRTWKRNRTTVYLRLDQKVGSEGSWPAPGMGNATRRRRVRVMAARGFSTKAGAIPGSAGMPRCWSAERSGRHDHNHPALDSSFDGLHGSCTRDTEPVVPLKPEALLEYLLGGVPFGFAATPGAEARGMPSARAVPPLAADFPPLTPMSGPWQRGPFAVNRWSPCMQEPCTPR